MAKKFSDMNVVKFNSIQNVREAVDRILKKDISSKFFNAIILLYSYHKWLGNEKVFVEDYLIKRVDKEGKDFSWSLGDGPDTCFLCSIYRDSSSCDKCPLGKVNPCRGKDSAWKKAIKGDKTSLVEILRNLTVKYYGAVCSDYGWHNFFDNCTKSVKVAAISNLEVKEYIYSKKSIVEKGYGSVEEEDLFSTVDKKIDKEDNAAKDDSKLASLLKEHQISVLDLQNILKGDQRNKPKVLQRFMSDDYVLFGAIGDTHINSIEEKLDALHTFYDICKKEGVKEVFHCGDIVSGQGIYPGQMNEIKNFGVHQQAKYAIENYPKVDGITSTFICGNHDLCKPFWATAGVDIGKLISAEREDLNYIGQYCADIEFNTGIPTQKKLVIRLLHPDSGMPYALSYRIQKIIENMRSGQKPDILLMGHLHTSMYLFHRNVHGLQVGCFEGQTTFLQRKGINPEIGGYICKARLGKGKDKIVSFTPTWIPFYD